MPKPIIVFTDGAASGNPGPGGWGTIIVTPAGHVTELGGGEPHTTNNRMELSAAIAAATHLGNARDGVEIYCDSTYVINGITSWIYGWMTRGWRTASGGEVLNQDLWVELHRHVSALKQAPRWHYVRGHRGVPGNERADEIAVAYTQGTTPDLYDGPLSKYPVDVLSLPAGEERRAPGPGSPARTKRGGRTGKAFSYLSLVDGVLERHRSWASCEERVRGRSGARFRKTLSPEDEVAIMAEWGYTPRDVRDR